MISTLSDSELRAQYENNASYDLEHSPTKARLFIEACRAILMRFAARSGLGELSLDLSVNMSAVQQQLDRAVAWLATHDEGRNGIIYVSLRRYRR